MMDQLVPYDADGSIDFSELIKLMVKLGLSVGAAMAIIQLIKRGLKSLNEAIE